MWNVITQCNLNATAGEPPALPSQPQLHTTRHILAGEPPALLDQAQLHAPKPKHTLTLGSAGRWPALLQQQLKLPAYSRQAHAAPSAPPIRFLRAGRPRS